MKHTPPGESWQSRAACTGSQAKAFHATSPARAKEICRPCPVRAECLHDALTSDAPSGVWGGLTRDERRRIPALPSPASAALTALRDVLAAYDTLHPGMPAQPPPAPPTRARGTSTKKTGRARKPATPDAKPAGKKAPKAKATAAVKAEPTTAKLRAAERAERRAKVAAMLREGATRQQIIDRLHVGSETITSVRKEAGLVPPLGTSGYRYPPEQRAEIERRTLEMLRAGATQQQITDEVGITAPTIIRIRREAGLPAPARGRNNPPPRTLDEGLAASVEPYGDGHARWTGPMAGRMPQLHAAGGRFNARRVIFERHHGRPPVGYVRSNCGDQACAAGAHLTDDVLRDALATASPTERTSPPMPATTGTASLTTEELLTWAETHDDSDVQATAQRTRAALVGLRNRHAADHELAQIDTETARLEQELAELRARRQELVPAKPKKRTDPNAAAARAWAKETGVDCPPTGRVPKAVMDAWREATGQANGSSS